VPVASSDSCARRGSEMLVLVCSLSARGCRAEAHIEAKEIAARKGR